MNVGKSKVMVFERNMDMQCRIILNGQEMES